MEGCRDVPALVGLRRQVMRRNEEPFSRVVDAPVHALKLLCLGDDGFVSVVEANGRAQAAFFGVRFGSGFYYVSGGTSDKCEGFGSYLFLTLIERWFAEQPRGKLYLGVTEPGYVPETTPAATCSTAGSCERSRCRARRSRSRSAERTSPESPPHGRATARPGASRGRASAGP